MSNTCTHAETSYFGNGVYRCAECGDQVEPAKIVYAPAADAGERSAWDYPTAARSIALNLAEFCDESLPYPEMIADAARKAAARLRELEAALRDLLVAVDESPGARATASAVINARVALQRAARTPATPEPHE